MKVVSSRHVSHQISNAYCWQFETLHYGALQKRSVPLEYYFVGYNLSFTSNHIGPFEG